MRVLKPTMILFVGVLSILVIAAQLQAQIVEDPPSTHFTSNGLDSPPFPNPGLSPDQVVKIQLEALRMKDASNNGIAITFRFASPANKRSTGPLERFAQMIKTTPYRWMINYRSAQFDQIQVIGEKAVQRVTLVGEDYTTIIYIIFLSKQTQEPCIGCWMTDAVFIELPDTEGTTI